MQSAWKVGLFVLVFAALLIAGYSIVGRSLLKTPVDTYYAIMDDTGGVDPGSRIKMAGVTIGHVRTVELLSPKEVKMTLDVRQGVFIPNDVQLSSSASLLSLSEAKLELTSEKGKEAGRLPVGSTIHLEQGSLLSSVLPEGEEVLQELKATLEATRELLSDPALKSGVKEIMAGTKTTLATLDKVLGETHLLIAENRGTLRQVVVNASAAVTDMRSGIRAVMDQIETADLPANVKAILASLEGTARRADELVAEMNTFVTDPAMRSAIANTVANMEEISRRGIDIAENTKVMTEDGKVITSRAIELAGQAQEIAAEAKVLLEKLNDVLGVIPTGGTRLAKPEISLESGRNFETDRFTTNVYLDYPLSTTSSIFGGVYDATEANQFTIQYTQKFHNNDRLRYGIYASKPGVGVDFYPTSRVHLSGELFDPNDLKFNVRARYLISNGVYGWLGVDRVFGQYQPLFGVGVKR